MVDKPNRKTIFKCFALKLIKLTFKSCHRNLDNELRPFQYRRREKSYPFRWKDGISVSWAARLHRKLRPRGGSEKSLPEL